MDTTADQLFRIFMPMVYERKARMKEERLKFVHYTTAENALNILRSRCVYMRNTTCMTDYSEFQHGLGLLLEVFRDAVLKQQFFDAMNACGENIGEDAVKLFDDWLRGLRPRLDRLQQRSDFAPPLHQIVVTL